MPDSVDAREAAFFAAIEAHSVTDLAALLEGGLSAVQPLQGKPPVRCLLEMYMRSERFPACLRLLLQRGGGLPDPALTAVLLDDGEALRVALRADPAARDRRHDLVSTFTPLLGASLLHVAAEYGHTTATRVLLEAGADVHARATDGHTPLFHTVSSLLDHGAPVMHQLLAAGARTDLQLPMLVWGRGFDWETTLFDVTPISYCQAGLLPQVHRREVDIYRNLSALLRSAGRPAPSFANVPNRYLTPCPS